MFSISFLENRPKYTILLEFGFCDTFSFIWSSWNRMAGGEKEIWFTDLLCKLFLFLMMVIQNLFYTKSVRHQNLKNISDMHWHILFIFIEKYVSGWCIMDLFDNRRRFSLEKIDTWYTFHFYQKPFLTKWVALLFLLLALDCKNKSFFQW